MPACLKPATANGLFALQRMTQPAAAAAPSDLEKTDKKASIVMFLLDY
jgi:hypothetical protein